MIDATLVSRMERLVSDLERFRSDFNESLGRLERFAGSSLSSPDRPAPQEHAEPPLKLCEEQTS